MKKYKNILGGLSLASTLLINGQSAIAKSGDNPEFRGSLFQYNESGTITVKEKILSAKFNLDTDENIIYKLTTDSITGASPTGATPSANNQSSTNPSGINTLINAGDIPKKQFDDKRDALSINYNNKLTSNVNSNLGLNISSESDYLSKGISATFNYDFNKKHNTLTLGIARNNDTIRPNGGFANYFATIVPTKINETRTKNTNDLLLGLSHIIDRNSLFQGVLSYSKSDGYHSDPYKVISIVDDITAQPIIEPTTGLDLTIYERRPDNRTKTSVFLQYKQNFSGDVLDLSYRLMDDDWGITSHTLDNKYKIHLSDTHYIQPHLRIYSQTKADFYQPFILQSDRPNVNANIYASADYRLSKMMAYTLGFEYGKDNTAHPWNISLEYYYQDNKEPDKFGSLNQFEINPDYNAVMVRFNFEF